MNCLLTEDSFEILSHNHTWIIKPSAKWKLVDFYCSCGTLLVNCSVFKQSLIKSDWQCSYGFKACSLWFIAFRMVLTFYLCKIICKFYPRKMICKVYPRKMICKFYPGKMICKFYMLVQNKEGFHTYINKDYPVHSWSNYMLKKSIYEPLYMITNNVAFWTVSKSLCSFLLSL